MKVNPDLKTLSGNDGAVILDIENDRVCTLNGTGAIIWQGFIAGEPTDAIVERLSQATGCNKGKLTQDLLSFVKDLEAQKLLSVSEL